VKVSAAVAFPSSASSRAFASVSLPTAATRTAKGLPPDSGLSCDADAGGLNGTMLSGLSSVSPTIAAGGAGLDCGGGANRLDAQTTADTTASARPAIVVHNVPLCACGMWTARSGSFDTAGLPAAGVIAGSMRNGAGPVGD
jgi:hypothetical protein